MSEDKEAAALKVMRMLAEATAKNAANTAANTVALRRLDERLARLEVLAKEAIDKASTSGMLKAGLSALFGGR